MKKPENPYLTIKTNVISIISLAQYSCCHNVNRKIL